MLPESLKQLPEKSKKEFEIDYEPFDPRTELEKFKKYDKEVKDEKLKEYKKELIEQKEGIAGIQKELEEQIRDNPELNQQKLMKTVLAKAPEFRLTKNQLDLFEKTLDNYVEKHQAVRQTRKEYPDDKELFKVCFGKKPEGIIEAIEGPITLYFRCHNLKDFAWIKKVALSYPEHPRALTREDLKAAELRSGSKMENCLIRSLENTITAEKAREKSLSDPEAQKTMEHEEQHAVIASLFRKQKLENITEKLVAKVPVINSIIRDFQNKKPPKILVEHLRYEKENYENFAKEEILAFYKSGVKPEKIVEYLLRPYNDGGIYDYFKKHKKAIEKILQEKLTPGVFKKNKKAIEKTLKQILVDEYETEIVNAVKSVEELEKMGESRDKIIYLLIAEPLSQWEKLVKRIKEVKK